jgi:hypothetical protein
MPLRRAAALQTADFWPTNRVYDVLALLAFRKYQTKTIRYDVNRLLRIQACENCALPINLITKE